MPPHFRIRINLDRAEARLGFDPDARGHDMLNDNYGRHDERMS